MASGMIHARKAATVTAEGDSFTIAADGAPVVFVPGTTTREVARYKLYAAGKTSRVRQGSPEANPGGLAARTCQGWRDQRARQGPAEVAPL